MKSEQIVKNPIPIVDGFPAWIPVFNASMLTSGSYHCAGTCKCCPVEWIYILFEGKYSLSMTEYSQTCNYLYSKNRLFDIKGSREPAHRVFRMLHKCLNNRMTRSEKNSLKVLYDDPGMVLIENIIDHAFVQRSAVVADVMNETFFRLGYDNGWKKPVASKQGA